MDFHATQKLRAEELDAIQKAPTTCKDLDVYIFIHIYIHCLCKDKGWNLWKSLSLDIES